MKLSANATNASEYVRSDDMCVRADTCMHPSGTTHVACGDKQRSQVSGEQTSMRSFEKWVAAFSKTKSGAF